MQAQIQFNSLQKSAHFTKRPGSQEVLYCHIYRPQTKFDDDVFTGICLLTGGGGGGGVGTWDLGGQWYAKRAVRILLECCLVNDEMCWLYIHRYDHQIEAWKQKDKTCQNVAELLLWRPLYLVLYVNFSFPKQNCNCRDFHGTCTFWNKGQMKYLICKILVCEFCTYNTGTNILL